MDNFFEKQHDGEDLIKEHFEIRFRKYLFGQSDKLLKISFVLVYLVF